jgi:ribonuclease E
VPVVPDVQPAPASPAPINALTVIEPAREPPSPEPATDLIDEASESAQAGEEPTAETAEMPSATDEGPARRSRRGRRGGRRRRSAAARGGSDDAPGAGDAGSPEENEGDRDAEPMTRPVDAVAAESADPAAQRPEPAGRAEDVSRSEAQAAPTAAERQPALERPEPPQLPLDRPDGPPPRAGE